MTISKKSKGGRPTKLSQEITDKICNAIRMGAYIETASAFAGINKDTFYSWLKKGARQKKGIFREFSDAVSKAMSEAELRDLDIIDKCAQGQEVEVIDENGRKKKVKLKRDWKAAAWKLERKFPSRWGLKNQNFEIEVPKEEKAETSSNVSLETKVKIAKRFIEKYSNEKISDEEN